MLVGGNNGGNNKAGQRVTSITHLSVTIRNNELVFEVECGAIIIINDRIFIVLSQYYQHYIFSIIYLLESRIN